MTQDNILDKAQPTVSDIVRSADGATLGAVAGINIPADEITVTDRQGQNITVSMSSMSADGPYRWMLDASVDADGPVVVTDLLVDQDLLRGRVADPVLRDEALRSDPQSVNDMLKEREKRYGAFSDHAAISQALKLDIRHTDGYDALSDSQREALEMIAHKIARILNGDPNYVDNWVDIAGYAQLVVNELEGK